MNKDLIAYTSKMKLLFVEDDESLQETLQDFFSVVFGNVTMASDGQEGLDIFNSGDFDIIIADILMPKLDGFEMSQAIRKIDEDIPIIIMSAEAEKEHIVEVFETGIDGYLEKPLNTEKLSLYLQKIVNNRILEEETKRT